MSTLKAYGFSPLFKIIENYISSTSSVLVEDSPPHLRTTLRQGNSLSPMLFDLLMDVLIRLIEKRTHDRLYDTYKVNVTTSISHLMYANDILLLLRPMLKLFTLSKTSWSNPQPSQG